MKTTIALAAATLISLSSAAFAAGHTAEVQTPSGKVVWYLGGGLDAAGGGANPSLTKPGPAISPRGNTANAAPGLVTALSQSEVRGLSLVAVEPTED